MMRIRTVKPEFWTNEDLASVSSEAALLAIGLLNHSDDEGYFKANPALIRAAVFPLRDLTEAVPKLLAELEKIAFIRLGVGSDGHRYGHVVKFKDHQRVDRPKRSQISGIVTFDEASTKDRRSIDDASTEEGKGREGKGDTSKSADADVSAPTFTPEDLAGIWNTTKPPECPAVQKLSDKRRKRAAQRIREEPEPEYWRAAIQAMHSVPFLRGGGQRGWCADFDWLLQPDSATKVLEGSYRDGPANPTTNHEPEYARRLL